MLLVSKMTDENMNAPVEIVESSDELEDFISHLSSKPEIAIDLEFDKNYYRFGFNLCLVQVFDGKTCCLIDPLSRNLDISVLFPLLEDPDITKVCFSFDEDLRLLHSLGCFPKNLYDLDIASRLLNYPAMSLSNLLIEILDIDPGESSQRSNWYRRPLSKNQVSYAANDVLHLFELKKALDDKAFGRDVENWIKEENSLLDQLDYSEITNNHLVKEKEKREFNEIEWHIFKKLIYWRHDLARNFNKPDYQLIDKKLLVTLAKNSTSHTDWINRPGIFKKIKTEHFAQQIHHLLASSRNEAIELGFKESMPAQKPLSKEEHRKIYTEKKMISRFRNVFFDPVKAKIVEKYGTETANYILSNRTLTDIITRQNGELESYKRELFYRCAEELGLDTSEVADILQ